MSGYVIAFYFILKVFTSICHEDLTGLVGSLLAWRLGCRVKS